MAELYVKPGNRERGWNDPPQLSYGLQQLQGAGAKRGPLTRRAAPPAASSGARTAVAAGEAPPPRHGPGLPAFSLKPVGIPPPDLPGPPPRDSATKPVVAETEEDCGVEDVLIPLKEALDNCRRSVRKQVCDDISKRLATLQQMWEEGKLSTPVKKGMRILTQELKRQHWDTADDIHRSLIVDHVAEVSQWMVGIKRLIAETRNLPAADPAPVDHEPKVETCIEPELLQD